MTRPRYYLANTKLNWLKIVWYVSYNHDTNIVVIDSIAIRYYEKNQNKHKKIFSTDGS